MWPFGKKKEKPVERSKDEYTLDTQRLWEEVTGEHEVERENGNGKIKFKGARARKLREADKVQDELCEDIDRQIERLREIRRHKKTTGSIRALSPAKKGQS